MRWVWLQALVFSLLGLISRTSDSTVPPNCEPEYPFMSAGDFNITKENFQPLLKKHEFVLMAITSSKDCDLCCPYERTISQIRDRNFVNKTSLFYDYKIKVGRLDLAKEGWFSSLHPNFRVLPSWVMYVRGEPFYIQNYHIISRLLNGIARVVEPYEFIQSMAAFERFMNHTKTDATGRHLVRNKVVAIFGEPDEYEEELDNFKRTALKSYWREESLFALVTKKEVVNEIYKKYGAKYLPNQYDKNSIFYLKLKNRFAKKEELKLVDFSKIGDLPAWLAKSSISPLEEMTTLNQFAFSTKAPLLVAFVDPQREIQTQAFLDQLEHLGTKYLNRVNFVWVDYRDNLQLMKRLGVEGFPLPCIGLESPHGSNEAYVLNKTNPHHKEIDQFLEDYFAKRLTDNQNLIVKVGMHKAKEEQDKVMLTKGLDVMDFYGLLYDDNADALVYFYNSSTSISESQDHRSEVVNFLAKFVPENLRLFTLRICSYDLGRFRMPEDIFNDRHFEMNSVYLILIMQFECLFPNLAWICSSVCWSSFDSRKNILL